MILVSLTFHALNQLNGMPENNFISKEVMIVSYRTEYVYDWWLVALESGITMTTSILASYDKIRTKTKNHY